jgi:hypothetical protein
MPAQDLSLVAAREIAQFLGLGGRTRLSGDYATLRGDL